MGDRRAAREWAVQFLFQRDFNRGDLEKDLADFASVHKLSGPAEGFALRLVRGAVAHHEEIDRLLQGYAEHWDIERMSAVDRNVLRLALFEMHYRPDIPPVVSLNEAVDIAKDFSGRESGKFVNGILDRALRDLARPSRTPAKPGETRPDMAGWLKALARTRRQIASALSRVLGGEGDLDEVSLEELEETLLEADVPVRLTGDLIEALEALPRGQAGSRRAALRDHLLAALGGPAAAHDWNGGAKPHTILVVGVNGSGKTTTAAKLARRCLNEGRRPLLGAADTFRAAGSDQLRIWGERVGCDVVAGRMGADAAAVAFDAMEAALARKADVLIVDTAGRMHTRKPLMQELEKIRRALGKRVEGAPHETWIVLDASIGQNALSQARLFHEICPLSGVIVSKLDGSSKAGFLFAVARELGVPVRYAGLGEGADDLAPFDAASFVDALLGMEPTEAEQGGA